MMLIKTNAVSTLVSSFYALNFIFYMTGNFILSKYMQNKYDKKLIVFIKKNYFNPQYNRKYLEKQYHLTIFNNNFGGFHSRENL